MLPFSLCGWMRLTDRLKWSEDNDLKVYGSNPARQMFLAVKGMVTDNLN